MREIKQLFHGFADSTPAGVRWQKLAEAKLAEVEEMAARIETMRRMLRKALRCGCVELASCAKLFRRQVP